MTLEDESEGVAGSPTDFDDVSCDVADGDKVALLSVVVEDEGSGGANSCVSSSVEGLDGCSWGEGWLSMSMRILPRVQAMANPA